MSNQYDLDIKNHYDQVAANDKNSSTSTMADLFIRESETKFIINQINKYSQNQDNNELTVLDVGCGYNEFKGKIDNLIGIDPYNVLADHEVGTLEYRTDQKFDVILCLLYLALLFLSNH